VSSLSSMGENSKIFSGAPSAGKPCSPRPTCTIPRAEKELPSGLQAAKIRDYQQQRTVLQFVAVAHQLTTSAMLFKVVLAWGVLCLWAGAIARRYSTRTVKQSYVKVACLKSEYAINRRRTAHRRKACHGHLPNISFIATRWTHFVIRRAVIGTIYSF